jgi:prepilin peptidase CpaA
VIATSLDGIAALYFFSAAFVLVVIAVSDFRTLRIRNDHVLALCVIVFLFWGGGVLRIGLADLALAAGMFILGFTFWLLGKLGGGDAKLLPVATLMVGMQNALLFAIALLAFALAWLAIARWGHMVALPVQPFPRILTLVEEKKVPYGLLIAAAAILTMLASIVGLT